MFSRPKFSLYTTTLKLTEDRIITVLTGAIVVENDGNSFWQLMYLLNSDQTLFTLVENSSVRKEPKTGEKICPTSFFALDEEFAFVSDCDNQKYELFTFPMTVSATPDHPKSEWTDKSKRVENMAIACPKCGNLVFSVSTYNNYGKIIAIDLDLIRLFNEDIHANYKEALFPEFLLKNKKNLEIETRLTKLIAKLPDWMGYFEIDRMAAIPIKLQKSYILPKNFEDL